MRLTLAAINFYLAHINKYTDEELRKIIIGMVSEKTGIESGKLERLANYWRD